MQVEDLLQQCTVKLSIPGQLGWGTGFFVAPGLILTCGHVVKALVAPNRVRVRWQQQVNFAEAELIHRVPDLDLALLQFTPGEADLPCVYLDEGLQAGQDLYFFGYPDEDFEHGCPVTGICEGFTGDVSPLIKFKQAQVRPGMSGSALLNRQTRKVCGMVKFTRNRSSDLGGGAIPTRAILEQFPELRSLQREFHEKDRRWVNLITTQPRIDFQPYLRSIATTYKMWWQLYTLTDTKSKQQQMQESAPTFDFGLMVQTVQEWEQEQSLEGKQEQEKVERFSVLEGLRKYSLVEKQQHVLLVGRPGSGKSTALARLLLEEATTSHAKIPVLVELRYWQDSIVDLIHTAIARHDATLKAVPLDRLLTNALLLFDGVNELPSEEARSQLIAFRRNYPQLPMIFTTRDLSLGGDLGIERKLEMLPLTEPQMRAFIRAYIPEQAEAMLRQLKNRLRELGQTPLLLWMLCEVFQQAPDNQLPSNLAGVFQAFTTMYEISSVRKHEIALLKGDVRPLSDRRLWKKALIAIASIMMQGKTPVDFRPVIHRDEAESELSRIFPNEKFPIRDILDDLLKYHLLENRSTEQIEFRHQLIQEYYAAEYLLQLLPNLTDEQLKRNYLNYLKWTEPISLMLALVDSEAQAVRVVKLGLDVDWMLGARLAGEVKPKFQTITVNLIDELLLPLKFKIQLFGLMKSSASLQFLNQSLDRDENFVRGETIRAIGKISCIEAIVSLRKSLKDRDIENRFLAAYQLADLGDRTCLPLLQQALHDEKYHIKALSSIEKIAREKLIPLLGEVLRGEVSEARIKATISLHLLLKKGYEGILPLLEIALHDQDSRVRSAAAHTLMNASSKEAMLILSQAWADEDMSVRNFVFSALEEYAEIYLEHNLEEALLGNSPSLRKRAIDAIQRTKLSSERIIQALLRVAFYDSDFLSRTSASTALIMLGNSCVIKSLHNILEKDDFEIANYRSNHSEAITLLLQICSEESIPTLIKVMNDKNMKPVVRLFAVKALGEIGNPSVAQILLDNLCASAESDDVLLDRLYQETIFALGKLGFQNLEDYIISILKNSDSPDTRKEAVEILGKMPTEKAKDTLLEALTDLDFSVRFSSAVILAKQSYIESIPVLIEALGRRNSIGFEESTVCQNAIDTLYKIGDEVIPKLESVLCHQDYQLRSNAKATIDKINGKLDSSDHIDIPTDDYVDNLINELLNKYKFLELIEMLNSSNADDAWQFASALTKISQPEQISLFNKHISESDSNIFFTYIPNLISDIQSRCQFYNYEIFQAHLAAQKAVRQTHPNSDPNAITIQTLERLTIMTDKSPIFNQQHATIGVNYAAEGSKIEFTQHISSSEQSFEILLTDYKQFIEQLQQKYPTLADPTTVPQIIEVEAKLLEAQDRQRWQNFLNLKRLWNGSKKAGIKVGEHFAENNVWAKGAIAFLEGVSEDVK